MKRRSNKTNAPAVARMACLLLFGTHTYLTLLLSPDNNTNRYDHHDTIISSSSSYNNNNDGQAVFVVPSFRMMPMSVVSAFQSLPPVPARPRRLPSQPRSSSFLLLLPHHHHHNSHHVAHSPTRNKKKNQSTLTTTATTTFPTTTTTCLFAAATTTDESIRTTIQRRRHQNSVSSVSNVLTHVIAPVVSFVTFCFIVAVVLVTWEDTTAVYALPSRQHRVAAAAVEQRSTTILENKQQQQYHTPWGAATIRGMGFGASDRMALTAREEENDDEERMTLLSSSTSSSSSTTTTTITSAHIPSYNEVMLQHRTERIPRWREQQKRIMMTTTTTQKLQSPSSLSSSSSSSITSVGDAVHTLVDCLQVVWKMRALAADYQWDDLRQLLHSYPLNQLEPAASLVRAAQIQSYAQSHAGGNAAGVGGVSAGDYYGDDVIGFDWGSCALRHCGALADAQEALDELDFLVGLFEPSEAIFCFDIVERSLRDMLTMVFTTTSSSSSTAATTAGTASAWLSSSSGSSTVASTSSSPTPTFFRFLNKEDVDFYFHRLPEYIPLHKYNPEENPLGGRGSGGEDQYDTTDDGTGLLDDTYFKALQELRID